MSDLTAKMQPIQFLWAAVAADERRKGEEEYPIWQNARQ